MTGYPADNPPLRRNRRRFLLLLVVVGALAAISYDYFATSGPTYHTDFQNPSKESVNPLQSQDKLQSSVYEIQRADGKKLPFTLEEARSTAEQEQGLMYRTFLDAGEGMIFLYPEAGERMIWMKNTEIALDILFIGEDGRILHIHPNAEPMSETIIRSPLPATAIIELRGGVANAYGIQEGDVLLLPQTPEAEQPNA
jgi:uncharacterized membrane protein (UPF0127 family)